MRILKNGMPPESLIVCVMTIPHTNYTKKKETIYFSKLTRGFQISLNYKPHPMYILFCIIDKPDSMKDKVRDSKDPIFTFETVFQNNAGKYYWK